MNNQPTLAGMTEAQVLAMKTESVRLTREIALAQAETQRHRHQVARNFAAQFAPRYLDFGAFGTTTNRAEFISRASVMHLKAQNKEPITTAELKGLLEVPTAYEVMQILSYTPLGRKALESPQYQKFRGTSK